MKTFTTGAETQEIAAREATKKFQDKGKTGHDRSRHYFGN